MKMSKVVIPGTLADVKDIYTCSGYFSDGKGYVEITADIIQKIETGGIIITEYHDGPLGELIYLSASSKLN